MGVRSKCLVPPVVVATGNTTRYTTPADETALVKWVSVANSNVASQTLTLFINAGSGNRTVLVVTVGAGLTTQIELWWVLQAGWALVSAATAASSLTLAVHGSELEGVAD